MRELKFGWLVTRFTSGRVSRFVFLHVVLFSAPLAI